MIDRMMCSMWCPCPADAQANIVVESEDELLLFTR